MESSRVSNNCGTLYETAVDMQQVADDILKKWPDYTKIYATPPLLIVCDDSGMEWQGFFVLMNRVLDGVVIDMKAVTLNKNDSLKVLNILLAKAAERRLPLILNIPLALAEDIPKIKETASAYSSFTLFFSSHNQSEDKDFDLILSLNWRICCGDVPIAAALFAEKTGFATNFFTPLKLMAVQTARRLLLNEKTPAPRLTLPPRLESLFSGLAASCLNLLQTLLPKAAEKLPIENKEAFIKGCLLECFEKKPERILHLYTEDPEDIPHLFQKLNEERRGSDFGAADLMREAQKKGGTRNWWPFDDKRLMIEGEADLLQSTLVYTGLLAFIATTAPDEKSLAYFWRFALQEDPGVIVSLSEEGQVFFKKTEMTSHKAGTITLFSTLSEISCEYQGKKSQFPHLYHSDWPDGGTIPCDQLYYCILEAERVRKPGRPPLVHCRAGIGRTGTFCAAYEIYLRFRAHEGSKWDFKPDIYSLVLQMNMQRYGMVMGKEQFESLFQFVLFLKNK